MYAPPLTRLMETLTRRYLDWKPDVVATTLHHELQRELARGRPKSLPLSAIRHAVRWIVQPVAPARRARASRPPSTPTGPAAPDRLTTQTQAWLQALFADPARLAYVLQGAQRRFGTSLAQDALSDFAVRLLSPDHVRLRRQVMGARRRDAYLKRCVQRRAGRLKQRDVRMVPHPTPAEPGGLFQPDLQPEAEFLLRLRVAVVATIRLKDLPRRVFFLRLRGLDWEAIGHQVGLTAVNARSVYYRARDRVLAGFKGRQDLEAVAA